MEKLSNQINDQRKKNIQINSDKEGRKEGNSKNYYMAIEFPVIQPSFIPLY